MSCQPFPLEIYALDRFARISGTRESSPLPNPPPREEGVSWLLVPESFDRVEASRPRGWIDPEEDTDCGRNHECEHDRVHRDRGGGVSGFLVRGSSVGFRPAGPAA